MTQIQVPRTRALSISKRGPSAPSVQTDPRGWPIAAWMAGATARDPVPGQSPPRGRLGTRRAANVLFVRQAREPCHLGSTPDRRDHEISESKVPATCHRNRARHVPLSLREAALVTVAHHSGPDGVEVDDTTVAFTVGKILDESLERVPAGNRERRGGARGPIAMDVSARNCRGD